MDKEPINRSRLKVAHILRRWTKRLALGLMVFVLLAMLAGATYQFAATRRLERQHPAPGRLIDVGGHRLHLHSQGSGSPAVIIDAGLSGASYDWETVATGIAPFSQVSTYDRAGYDGVIPDHDRGRVSRSWPNFAPCFGRQKSSRRAF